MDAAAHPGLQIEFVHTGQHFDKQMAEIFFTQFGLQPDYLLQVDHASPVKTFGQIMSGLEDVFVKAKPDLVMVVGDVNSTLAAALTANKMNIPIAHLESGLRSLDMEMPEEINRILTDKITDYFFITENSGIENLKREGVSDERLFFVGNTMIDSMVLFKDEIDKSDVLENLGLKAGDFALMTMHRPSNVDTEAGIKTLLEIIKTITGRLKLLFPVHPRTLNNIRKFGMYEEFSGIEGLIQAEPLDYFAFQKLTATCKFVITDSGGIQEETTFLGIPCLTLRNNTERPVTAELGTNKLIAYDPVVVARQVEEIFSGVYKKGTVPPLWDGSATQRILQIISKLT
jgi:UDP-N-acetylglucosamine 2-epimerase (non-hydrolysing)